jgi:hypothetical protein
VANFSNSNKIIRTGQSISILIPPSPNQRVRYENECKKILRYISVLNNQPMTIEVNERFLIFFYYLIQIDS